MTTPKAILLSGVLISGAILIDGFLERRSADVDILECVTMTRTATGKETRDITEREFAMYWLNCAEKRQR